MNCGPTRWENREVGRGKPNLTSEHLEVGDGRGHWVEREGERESTRGEGILKNSQSGTQTTH